jgi:hypothetical protein
MWRAEWRAADQSRPGGQTAGDGVDGADFDRLVISERRQDPREALGEHRLPRPGRADQEDVVPARGRDLERALRGELSTDVGEVELGIRRHVRAGGREVGRLDLIVVPAERPERRDRMDADTRHGPRLRCVHARQPDGAASFPPGRGEHGQGAPHAADGAVESQLAYEHAAVDRIPTGDLTRGEEDRHRDREIEAAAFLPDVRRREIDGDLPGRELEP